MRYTDAYLNGWLSHKNGVDLAENPYPGRAQVFTNQSWHIGWYARHDAVRDGTSLKLDDEIIAELSPPIP